MPALRCPACYQQMAVTTDARITPEHSHHGRPCWGSGRTKLLPAMRQRSVTPVSRSAMNSRPADGPDAPGGWIQVQHLGHHRAIGDPSRVEVAKLASTVAAVMLLLRHSSDADGSPPLRYVVSIAALVVATVGSAVVTRAGRHRPRIYRRIAGLPGLLALAVIFNPVG